MTSSNEISVKQVFSLFKSCSSESELKLKAAVQGFNPELLFSIVRACALETWKGQWANHADEQVVTIHDFYETMKSKSSYAAKMNDLCESMCYMVKYS